MVRDKNMCHEVKYIHQILVSESLDEEYIVRNRTYSINIESSKRIYPESKYIFWNNKMIEKFIKMNFSKDVFTAYNKLLPYTYKSDLARYCILYFYGGMYIDVEILLLSRWNIPKGKKIAAFRNKETLSSGSFDVNTGLIWALPGQRELSEAINLIVKNCRNEYYGLTPSHVSGSFVLGKVLSESVVVQSLNKECRQYVGEVCFPTPEHVFKNDAYVTPDYVLVALKMEKDLSYLNKENIDIAYDYIGMWQEKKIFAEGIRDFDFKNREIDPVDSKVRDDKSDRRHSFLANISGYRDLLRHNFYHSGVEFGPHYEDTSPTLRSVLVVISFFMKKKMKKKLKNNTPLFFHDTNSFLMKIIRLAYLMESNKEFGYLNYKKKNSSLNKSLFLSKGDGLLYKDLFFLIKLYLYATSFFMSERIEKKMKCNTFSFFIDARHPLTKVVRPFYFLNSNMVLSRK